MKLFFIIFSYLLSTNTQAFSKNPFPDGKVGIKVINSTPCLYISKNQLNGWYVIMVSSNDEKGNLHSWHYKNSFEKHYPTENQCVLLNTSNFQNLKLRESTPYFIELIPSGSEYDQFAPPPNFDGFSSRICLKRDQEKHLQIQDYIYGKCMDREADTQKAPTTSANTVSDGWLDRLLNWFKELW